MIVKVFIMSKSINLPKKTKLFQAFAVLYLQNYSIMLNVEVLLNRKLNIWRGGQFPLFRKEERK